MNPFKPDDKVLTQHKGVEVEATVRLVWNDEVQVRTADGILRWRTVKTVKSVVAASDAPPADAATVSAPAVDGNAPAAEQLAVDPAPEAVETVASPVATGEPPAPQEVQEPTQEVQELTQEVQELTQAEATIQPKTDVVPCGASDVQPATKRDRKARRRR